MDQPPAAPPHAAGEGYPPAPSAGNPPYLTPAGPSEAEAHVPEAEAAVPPAAAKPVGQPSLRDAEYDDVFDDEFDETRRARPEDYASAYDEYADEFAPEPPRRRGLGVLLFILALLLIVAIAGGLVYFYQTMGGGSATKADVPVIAPQQKPVKVKPKPVPARKKPAGRKQIYDRILGDGAEQPERIVPSEEKPLPPPAAPSDSMTPEGSGTDPLPLPLPPPPALDGGQGSVTSPKGDSKTASAVPVGAPPEGKRVTASLPPAAPPPDAAAQPVPAPMPEPETGQAVPARDGGVSVANTTRQRVEKPEQARAASASTNANDKMVPTPRKTAARKKVLTKRKALARKARGKARTRVVARRPAAGPRSILPPAAAPVPGARAFASLPPAAATAPRPVAPIPAKPRKVTNFNTGRKLTNFSSAHPATNFNAAPARVAALPPKTQPASRAPVARAPAARPPATSSGGKGYIVQLASYRSQADALREYQRIRARHSSLLGGLTPRIQQKNLGAAGTFYRLGVGPLASRAQARKLCNALIASGERDCLVRRQ